MHVLACVSRAAEAEAEFAARLELIKAEAAQKKAAGVSSSNNSISLLGSSNRSAGPLCTTSQCCCVGVLSSQAVGCKAETAACCKSYMGAAAWCLPG